MTKTLTQKQKIVYDYIAECLAKSACSPTIAELATFLGVSSLRTVTQYLESLEKKGLIRRSKNQSRGIRLTGASETLASTVSLPIISAAGCDNLSVFADQAYNEFITIDRSFLGGKKVEEMVIFRALGDSMEDGGIKTGDLVLTQITQDVKPKDKVVAMIDGMAVIKQINFSPNAIILSPMSHSNNYHPIVMKRDFQIFGKVIEVIQNSFFPDELIYEEV